MKKIFISSLISLLIFSNSNAVNLPWHNLAQFSDEVLLSKDFETVYDFIKDDAYREQREQYRNGLSNEHPMDTFVKKMIQYNIDLKTFMLLVFCFMQAKIDASYQNEFQWSDEYLQKLKQATQKKVLNLRRLAESAPRKITFDTSVENYFSKEFFDTITEIYEILNMCGKLIVYVGLHPSHRISSNSPEELVTQELFLDPTFFELDSDIQKGILIHELCHIMAYNYLEKYFWDNIDISIEQIKSSQSRKLSEILCEYIADQGPAMLNLEYAELIKQSLEYIAEESPCKDQFKNKPHYIDRYNAVKTIAQLHKTFERLERGITHPR